MTVKSSTEEETASLLPPEIFEEKIKTADGDVFDHNQQHHIIEDFDTLNVPEASLPISKPTLTARIQSHAIAFLRVVLLGLLPSFVTAYFKSAKSAKPTKPRFTGYLDGLRGGAAWIVWNYHLAYVINGSERYGWGSSGRNWQFWKMPVLRILVSGSFSVSVFFVISGFALSIIPVLAMRKRTRDGNAFVTKMAGAIFRRPVRLFLPSVVSSFIVAVAIHFGYFAELRQHQRQYEKFVTGIWNWTMWPDRLPTLSQQLWDWFVKTRDWNSQYNGVLWTIRLEFYSSLALYLTHAAIYPMSRGKRTITSLLLISFFMFQGSWSMPLFWAGLIIADHTQLLADEDLDLLMPSKQPFYRSMIKRFGLLSKIESWTHRIPETAIPWVMFILGIWAGSVPEADNDSGLGLGFHWVMYMTPDNFRQPHRFWEGVGAVMVVYSMTRLPLVSRFFGSKIMSYAGRLSFSFYLVHGPIVHGLGRVIFYHCMRAFGRGSVIGFCAGYVILLSFIVWVADIFMRAIEEPSVRWAAKLQKVFFSEMP